MAAMFTAIGAAAKTAFGGLFAGGAAQAAGSGVVTLSRVLSAGSALAALGQGFAASAQLKTQAAFAQAEAEQETAAGAAQARDLAREYADLRSEQTVIQLANGLNIGVGTPVNVAESTQRLADQNIETTRANARNRSNLARLRARGLMSEARSAIIGGIGSAGQYALDSAQLTG